MLKQSGSTDQGILKTNYSGKKAHCMGYDVSLEESKLPFLKRLLFYGCGNFAYDGFQPEIWCKLYRRTLLEGIFFDEKLKFGEDMIFLRYV